MTKVVESAALQAWITANERDETTAVVPPEPEGPPVPVGITGTWAIVFQDEFDDDELNTEVWNPNWLNPGHDGPTQPINTAEICAYDPLMVSIEGGNLVLEAQKKSTLAYNGTTYPWRSGMVESYKGSDGQGWQMPLLTSGESYVFESKVQFPVSTGQASNFCAWWMVSPASGDRSEVDIVENLSDGANWHYHERKKSESTDRSTSGDVPPGNWVGWHTYSVKISKSSSGNLELRFFYDGQPAGEKLTGVRETQLYLVLNHGISDEHGPQPPIPGLMLVDYVRVWRAA